MRYLSTRGGVQGLSFEDTLIAGLAEDGGLLVPDSLPQVRDQLPQWRNLSYQELSLEIVRSFTGGAIPEADLRGQIEQAYRSFTHPEVTPVRTLGRVHLLELFHGPTFAFKDVALQLLGHLFEHVLKKRRQPLRILGATSGDTGSAAIHGMRGHKDISVFMLHPKGRVSPVQERQMTTVLDANVHNIAVEGLFDDAQHIVKELFGDLEFKTRHHLGAVNSINWARILVQIVYYFYAWGRVSSNSGEAVNFVVPSGNFGNVLAGHYARQMGLPIHRLVVATNENDILHRFFSKGEYHTAGVRQTLSPSMDIQISSNFERYLFDLSGRSPEQLRRWMQDFQETGCLTIEGERLQTAQATFGSARVDEAGTLRAIRETYEEYGYLLDPHTAVGVEAAKQVDLEGPVVCLACAHPAKFSSAVHQAAGTTPEMPPPLAELENLETRCAVLPAQAGAVREYLTQVLNG
ncbi:MAG: threonine synthase [Deltaproteobacteria bacterium]|jgi:threonine synthase|nr:threonine synthase [Deltaproteobacteria bacterium]